MSPPPSSTSSDVSAALTRSVHDHWRLFLGEEIVVSLLGLAAIVAPLITGLIVTAFLGWLFLIAGIVGLVFTVRARQAPGFGWALLSALAAVIAGTVLLLDPLQSLATLTFVLTAFFVVDGLVLVFLAIALRRKLSGKWEWMMVNGVVDLLLAGIIISGLPGTLVWALGLLVGIDMMFGGATLIAMALAARKAALS